jgi:hypothetical protein
LCETSDECSEFLLPTLGERCGARTDTNYYTWILTYFRGGSCKYLFKEYYKKKVKQSAPLLARSGPEGSRKLRFPDFMTTAQGGGRVVSVTYWPPLPPGNTPGTPFC